MNIKKDLPFIIIGILLLSLVFWRWFLPGYIYNGDTGFLFGENFTSYYHSFLWISNLKTGYPLTEIPRVLINGFVGLFGQFGLDRNGSVIRLFFLFPYCIFGFIGVYYLTGLYTSNKHYRVIGGLLYVINTPVILSLSMGHLHQIVPLGLFPWIILFIEKYIQIKKNYLLFYIIILLFISSVYEFRFAYITFLAILIALAFGFGHKNISFKNLISTCIILGGGFILVNLYWIVPFLNVGAGDVSQLLSRGPFGNGYRNILNGIGQFHSYRNGGLPVAFIKQTMPLYFFILPISALIGLFAVKNKAILLYYLYLLLGILLVKQAGLPFTDLFERIYNNLPGFNMYREGSRFFQFIALAYALIIPIVLNAVYQKSFGSSKIRVGYYCLLGGIYFYLCAIAFPIVFGLNKTFFQPRYPDPEYAYINKFINQQNESFKILYVPGVSHMVFNNTHPGVSFVDSINTIYTGTITITGSTVINMNGFDTYLDNVGIKYVILYKEIPGNENPFYRHESRNNYKVELQQNKNLIPITVPGTTDIEVYQNSGYKALINNNYSGNHEFINPVTYHIEYTIPKGTEIIPLDFLQSFHQEWKLYPYQKNVNTFKYLNIEGFFNETHTKLYSYANQRTIDRKTIIEEFPKESYNINDDGSITVRMILYFRPQSRFYVGALGTGITLLSICLRLVRNRRKRKHLSVINHHEKQ